MRNTGEHYRIYEDFVRDLRHDDRYPFIRYVADYHGEEIIKLCPSQHPFLSDYQQRKITNEWANYLSKNVLPLKEVQVCTRLNQAVFDGLCEQNHLESLRMKWVGCKNIHKIVRLTNLKKLFIELGTSIEDITPIARMTQLEVLILGNTVKVFDYSCLKNLKNLKVLGICSYQSHINTVIPIKSDSFLDEMEQLEYVDLWDTRVNG